MTGSALGGVVIGAVVAAGQLARAFPGRHEPAPPNHWTKLPFILVLIGVCVVFALDGDAPWVFGVLAAFGLFEVALILRGRNPWWMRSPFDQRREPVDGL